MTPRPDAEPYGCEHQFGLVRFTISTPFVVDHGGAVRRWGIVFLVIGVAALSARQFAAQAQNCAGDQCIYLATVRLERRLPATPTNTPIPPGPNEDACVTSGPAMADGAQVWLMHYNLFPGESTFVCMRLSQGGNGIAGAIGRALARYPNHDQSLGSEQTRDGGTLAIPFTVEQIPAGMLIVIDAEIGWNDRLYGARTQFLSQPVPTPTPTPTLTKTPAPTPTNTPSASPTP